MIELELSPEALGNARFAFSPLAEVGTSVRLLGAPRPHHLHTPWVRGVRDRLAGVDLGLLQAIAPPGMWAPDFLFPRPAAAHANLEAQLTDLLTLSPERLRADLDAVWSERAMPRRARELYDDPVRAPALIAEAVWDYWDAAIAPYWPRMCGVLEDDVSFRASRSVNGGLYDLLAGLHEDVSLDGNRMLIDLPKHDDAKHAGVSLVLVPSVFVWPRLVMSHHRPQEFEITYAARGVGRLWESVDVPEPAGDRLAALLGRGRARILSSLSVPMSTTQLARALGQSPGAVSMHLSVLREAGMVESRRAGRSVMYRQTPLGLSVVAVSTSPDAARGGRLGPE